MIRFLYDNKWGDGTLTISSEAANFPGSNTQHRWWQKTWRSLVTSICYLDNHLESNISMNVVALKYTNLTATAVVTLYCADESTFTPAHDSQAFSIISQDVMIEYFTAMPALDYWRLAVIDNAPANPDGYLTIGRVFLGTYWSPTRNFTLGGGRQKVDDTTELNVGEEGHVSSVVHQRPLTFQYTFERIPSSDLDVFIAMFKTHGMVGGFFITEDSASPTTTTYYVQFAGPLQIKPEYNSRYTVTVSLVEAQ